MVSTYNFLAQHGVCAVEPLYSSETIDQWNKKIDAIIASQKKPRRYVTSQQLHETGLLSEIFNDNMRNLIAHLIPDAVLYHCHIYEIDGKQSQSHIRTEDGFLGWHRDDECLSEYEFQKPKHISIFIYMTDVEPDNGPFEIANYPPRKNMQLIANKPCYSMLGKSGYSFIFNRTYIHRAHPNLSPVNRRLLKLSIQPPELLNPRIKLPEFTNVLQAITGTDISLEHLFGGSVDMDAYQKIQQQHQLSSYPPALPLEENSTIKIAPLHEVKTRIKNSLLKLRYRLSAKVREI